MGLLYTTESRLYSLVADTGNHEPLPQPPRLLPGSPDPKGQGPCPNLDSGSF